MTDKGLRAIKDGAVDKTLEHLREAGIDVVVFDGVEPNPKTPTCDGLDVFVKSNAISSLPSAVVARMTAVKASASQRRTKAISIAMPGLNPDQSAAADRRGEYHRRYRQRSHPSLRADQYQNQSEVCDCQLAQPCRFPLMTHC